MLTRILILIFKIVGIILSGLSLIGSERLRRWEDKLRTSLGRESINHQIGKIIEKIQFGLGAPLNIIRVIYIIFSIYLTQFLMEIILYFLAPIVLNTIVLLPSAISIVPLFYLFSSMIIFGFYILTIALFSKTEDQNPEGSIDEGYIHPLYDFAIKVLVLFMGVPFFVLYKVWRKITVIAFGSILYFLLALIPATLARVLNILRHLIEAILSILALPYLWLDKQVQKRKLESTLGVIGVLVAIMSEIASNLVK
jgi:hypothetical protein